jgi:hypothetical protein
VEEKMKPTGRTQQVSFQVNPAVWARFKSLVENSGVTTNFAFERVLVDVINAGEIPGIARLNLDAAGYPEEVKQRTVQDALMEELEALKQKIAHLQPSAQFELPDAKPRGPLAEKTPTKAKPLVSSPKRKPVSVR